MNELKWNQTHFTIVSANCIIIWTPFDFTTVWPGVYWLIRNVRSPTESNSSHAQWTNSRRTIRILIFMHWTSGGPQTIGALSLHLYHHLISGYNHIFISALLCANLFEKWRWLCVYICVCVVRWWRCWWWFSPGCFDCCAYVCGRFAAWMQRLARENHTNTLQP